MPLHVIFLCAVILSTGYIQCKRQLRQTDTVRGSLRADNGSTASRPNIHQTETAAVITGDLPDRTDSNNTDDNGDDSSDRSETNRMDATTLTQTDITEEKIKYLRLILAKFMGRILRGADYRTKISNPSIEQNQEENQQPHEQKTNEPGRKYKRPKRSNNEGNVLKIELGPSSNEESDEEEDEDQENEDEDNDYDNDDYVNADDDVDNNEDKYIDLGDDMDIPVSLEIKATPQHKNNKHTKHRYNKMYTTNKKKKNNDHIRPVIRIDTIEDEEEKDDYDNEEGEEEQAVIHIGRHHRKGAKAGGGQPPTSEAPVPPPPPPPAQEATHGGTSAVKTPGGEIPGGVTLGGGARSGASGGAGPSLTGAGAITGEKPPK